MFFTTYYQSPIGLMEITTQGDFLCRINIVEKKSRNSVPRPIVEKTISQLTEYFSGKRRDFDLPLFFEGTPFQKSVWKQLQAIPYAKTATYKDIADKINNPKAVRAVGQAIHHNPFTIVLPCHRIIGSNGSLTGYAHGIEIKKWLLQHEQQK